MQVKAFFDAPTYTLTYVAFDPATRDAVIIDPVLDFDPLTWRTSTSSVDQVQEFVRENSLQVRWVLDTHAHADHLTGMRVAAERFGAPSAIGKEITFVQDFFAGVYNLEGQVHTDGRQFDKLLEDGEVLDAGGLSIKALHTPGHTPACLSYQIGDTVFTGDALFMPDYGTGRCDFPNGSAEALYESVTGKLYKLDPATRVFVGHDYLPDGRPLAFETTIGESMERNVQLRAGTTKADFIQFRNDRDKTLAPPKLILQSLQVNIDAGKLPEPESNGLVYFKMPVNFLGGK
jgi:glyoxylase-like metal-dependent hydrolase (beta-lactamase superfamily II)